MDQRKRRSLARCLAVLVTPVVVLGVLAGMAPAAAALAGAPVSLQEAIGRSLGAAGPAAGFSQTAELTASGMMPGGEFGVSVALSAAGTTALVGAPVRATGTGAAYVFTLRHGTWSQAAALAAADAAPGDEFGFSVALSALGGTALAGAPFRNTGAGAAYVFTEGRG